MDNKIKYYADIRFYFRVHNSYMFGGKGSIGYMKAGYNECTKLSEQAVQAAYEAVVAEQAKLLNVAQSEIECISREEYEKEV